MESGRWKSFGSDRDKKAKPEAVSHGDSDGSPEPKPHKWRQTVFGLMDAFCAKDAKASNKQVCTRLVQTGARRHKPVMRWKVRTRARRHRPVVRWRVQTSSKAKPRWAHQNAAEAGQTISAHKLPALPWTTVKMNKMNSMPPCSAQSQTVSFEGLQSTVRVDSPSCPSTSADLLFSSPTFAAATWTAALLQ